MLKKILSQYLSSELPDLENLSDQPHLFSIGCMVTNIKDYGAISETLALDDLSVFINNYYGIVNNLVSERNGILLYALEDITLSIFGYPSGDKKNVIDNLVNTSFKVRECLSNQVHQEKIKWKVNVGVNYGSALVGAFGEKSRLHVTAIGSEVNHAFKLSRIGKSGTVCISNSINMNDFNTTGYDTKVKKYNSLEYIEYEPV